ncbi:hypothetical protein P775_13690 [Puniceibacterium antarcticum]|uniref:Transposase IS110-like N-terminal domain-containing protein n=1 Tax=Puniceibacterium antarcticum TaxID=1206336 RepID=A0A2G8RDS4_9RHOB|nr:transposase [Puniceibacterium antarcticum]PIL19571.1 hypothetical protein P775_13690 [Puniceibacterium antarcticum]
MAGHVKFRKKLTREQFRRFMADQSACVVVFEACGSASYCAREIEKLGHEARLIAVQYGKPFVKRQKNDAADAEAVVFAVQRPEMRFVSPKSGDLQARAVLLRSRESLVHQRTALVNALRAILYEYGHVFPLRIVQVKWIDAWIKTLKHVSIFPNIELCKVGRFDRGQLSDSHPHDLRDPNLRPSCSINQ